MKSLTYAMIAAVTLAAMLSITLLPACLAILGSNVDALGVRTLFRVPFLANWKVSRVYLNWLADRLQKTKTREEVEAGFWGKLVNVVMKRPLVFAIPIVVGMILLVIPLHNLSFGGGISEKYLPPDNSVRLAQQNFDKLFPGYRTEPADAGDPEQQPQQGHRPAGRRNPQRCRLDHRVHRQDLGRAPLPDDRGQPCVAAPNGTSHPKNDSVRVIQNGLAQRERRGEEARRTAVDRPAARADRAGRRHPGARAGQHPQPVRQSPADGW